MAGQWLAEDRGECRTDKVITAVPEQDMKEFKQLFSDHTRKNAFDDHIWVSVFSRPTRSNFTRVQRLSVCLAIVMMAMLTSCMWYKTDDTSASNSGIEIGPIKLTYHQVFVGLASSVIVVPPSIVVMFIFRRARQRNNPHFKQDNLNSISVASFDKLPPKEETKLSLNVTSNVGSTEKAKEAAEDSDQKKKKKKPLRLPWWSLFFAYFLVFAMVFLGGFFTIFYSLDWGKDKSLDWLMSMVFSFIQSIFVVQPLKVNLLNIDC